MPPPRRKVPSPRIPSAGYSGTPLPKKLGINADYCVHLIDAPRDFERTLEPLEEGATTCRIPFKSLSSKINRADLAVWFVESTQELQSGVKTFAKHCPSSGVWICWKKKTAMTKQQAMGAIGEADVRSEALQVGLVDFKVCALDATWSGLKFVPARREK